LQLNSVPVGAVVVDADGHVVAQGVNEFSLTRLAHAEINACNALPAFANRRNCELWVTLEPCPMCTGAIRMMQLRAVRYAARDPAAGSTSLLQASEFMREVSCAVVAPSMPALEFVVVALISEYRERTNHKRWSDHWKSYRPAAVSAGQSLARAGSFETWRQAGIEASAVYEAVLARLGG
jgi:tRNA(adenine34) deaminase